MSIPCRVFQSGECEITGDYGNGHGGIDLVNKGYSEGWITAHSDGVVVQNRTDCKGFVDNGSYGNFVKIRHNDGYYTLYAHLRWDTVQVDVGTYVRKGDLLGFQGATGYAFGTHLHFEVRTPDDVRIDPTPYINAELPYEVPITPNVEKDISKNQVEVYIDYLRVRTVPSLDGYILGFTNVGYYDVLDSYESDGYTWFKIADDNWIAYSDEWAKYYPKEDKDYKVLYEEALLTIDVLENKIKMAIKDLS